MEAEMTQKRDAVDPTHRHPFHQAGPPSPPGKSLDEKNGVLTRVSSSPVHQSEDADNIVVPTEEERRTLRRVPGHIPNSAWLVVIVEFAERFSYYGTTGPFVNYIQRPLPIGGNGAGAPAKGSGGVPGALGKGQQASTGLTTYNSFFSYCTPILGAIIADAYWGKFKTINFFVIWGGIGHIILTATAIPSVLQHSPGGAFAGFIISITIIAFATGAIKSNVSPLIAEQIPDSRETVKMLPSGEKVIVDPNLTIQRVFMYFYLMINIGSLSSIATTEVELHIGFWLSYLIPTIMYIVVPLVLFFGRNLYIKYPPRGSIHLEALQVLRRVYKDVWSWNPIEMVHRMRDPTKWDKARPNQLGLSSTIEQSGELSKEDKKRMGLPTWDDTFVDEMKRTVNAVKVFVFFPLTYGLTLVPDNQMTNNIVSQAGTMSTHGVPNDLLQNIDPIALIILIPLMDRIVYPGLRRLGWVVRPIQRITFGFILAALAMVYTSILQNAIYRTNPCGKFVSNCDSRSSLNVWLQTPAYVLIAASEIFASITGLEYAFTKAPLRMKSLVTAAFLFTTAISNAISEALVPVSEDPHLVWNYAGCGIAAFVGGVAFWICFHHLDREEESQNEIGREGRSGERVVPKADVEQ
ncbi:putative MFS peptide transporter [Rhizoctonia solani 123E]|uniref:Putative MFS peptide transporter n=1 Tax=Rhizoctonia solani 123E TaxID=1423351 RepID=A0A074RWQ5_9AGAM|nr:putative MFS peptide transporter [Rhizoctonia solani 123E]